MSNEWNFIHGILLLPWCHGKNKTPFLDEKEREERRREGKAQDHSDPYKQHDGLCNFLEAMPPCFDEGG